MQLGIKIPKMKIRSRFSNLFFMTKSEQNGAIVLLVILILVLILRFILPFVIRDNTNYIAEIEQKIKILEYEMDSIGSISEKVNVFPSGKVQNTKTDFILFEFNPNIITKDSLLLLGFNAKVASTLVNFRNKGGRFYKRADLMKVYGMDSLLYRKLYDSISIPRSITKRNKIAKQKNVVNGVPVKDKKEILYSPQKDIFTVELNSADTSALIQLRGVGSVYANRICKFRDYLGGFVTIEQLKEVYNFPEATYKKIKPFITLDSSKVTKININFAEINDLKKHPYCDYKLARKIINYRANNGQITCLTQLTTDSVITKSEFQKLSPYLTIQ